MKMRAIVAMGAGLVALAGCSAGGPVGEGESEPQAIPATPAPVTQPAESPSQATPSESEDAPEEESEDFCEVLRADSATAATVFGPALFGDPDDLSAAMAGYGALLDQVEQPPAELADEFELWRDFLGAVEDDPSSALDPETRTDDVRAAGDALFDEYLETCF